MATIVPALKVYSLIFRNQSSWPCYPTCPSYDSTLSKFPPPSYSCNHAQKLFRFLWCAQKKKCEYTTCIKQQNNGWDNSFVICMSFAQQHTIACFNVWMSSSDQLNIELSVWLSICEFGNFTSVHQLSHGSAASTNITKVYGNVL